MDVEDHFLPGYQTPVGWSPVGLVTWYAEDGASLAMTTPWMALLGGDNPSVRVAWPSLKNVWSSLWLGGDFVLNLPTESCLVTLRQLSRSGQLCLPAENVLMGDCLPGLKVKAPRLFACPVQIECYGGVLVDNGYESDLCGEVALLHRDGEACAVKDVSKLCFGRSWTRSGES